VLAASAENVSPVSEPVRIIGSYLSPYVRKVLVCLDLKGVDYRIGNLSIADIAIGCLFRTVSFARFETYATRRLRRGMMQI
jgi:glutathione S-transferase